MSSRRRNYGLGHPRIVIDEMRAQWLVLLQDVTAFALPVGMFRCSFDYNEPCRYDELPASFGVWSQHGIVVGDELFVIGAERRSPTATCSKRKSFDAPAVVRCNLTTLACTRADHATIALSSTPVFDNGRQELAWATAFGTELPHTESGGWASLHYRPGLLHFRPTSGAWGETELP